MTVAHTTSRRLPVADLIGAELDAAVALAERRGLSFELRGQPLQCFVDGMLFAPSTDWSQGGPFIARKNISLLVFPDDSLAYLDAQVSNGQIESSRASGDGPTPLIAAMRAYVASRFGEAIEFS